MSFVADTYICLDVPMPIAQFIKNVRLHHRDEFRAALPVEITVAGSNGVGVVEHAQNEKAAFAILDTIAMEIAPLEISFSRVVRFPETDVFAFLLTNADTVRALHERIATSGIQFKPSPFLFTPHCTLRSRSPVTEEEATQLLSLQRSEHFVLDTMSVYMLDKLPMSVLHRVKLSGARKGNG
jgi:2'-5' RNA ligase